MRNLTLSGIKGIKVVKTAKKITFNYQIQAKINQSVEEKTEEVTFDVIGSNLQECLKNPYVNPYRTISNDIYEIYSVLGVEAARQCLINEIKEVLKPYSIYINYRHLAILADWMTSRGKLVPVNRFGINRVRDVSILRKATFEETMDVLFDAAAFSDVDPLTGVSERIIFGEKIKMGSNICELEVDLDKVGKIEYEPLASTPLEQEKGINMERMERKFRNRPEEIVGS